ncbi:hypothetical protein R0137_05835 [Congregibacter brevis]|uniref:Uncharacterized protein n=1 Tax=Congregibacter brevis TaxID=3081201 RepID=A0ABZ0IEW5_9GAMM|nr:hypothetical protein R0137_05835 [Congregibacter sp. IMCC45268]
MIRPLVSALIVLAVGACFAADGFAAGGGAAINSKALQRCVYIDDKIEHYTRLRRKGGSNAQMASWRKSRSRYEDEFRSARCRQFSHFLRRKNR